MKKLLLLPFAFLLAGSLAACADNANDNENGDVLDENVDDTQTGNQEDTDILDNDTNNGTDTGNNGAVETEDGMGTNNNGNTNGTMNEEGTNDAGTNENGTTDNGTETETELRDEEKEEQ
ncbi:hypothetical protein U5N28_02755 [Lysinibacillus telephonicus]|uniref:Uncharacterized protein n=1 Tax=Lysinibacillus telephonicus TaxID=1714840 RepID=A0A431UX73_9BACI|nr:hypothetical protein [Lysinibacillus telephonicus]RTQ96244.1 hypothetical protein EKG35_00915 [Lysinibacillus telephonicus]